MSKARQLSSFNKQLLSDGRIVSTALGPGAVVQVVSKKSNTQVTTSSTDFVNTGLYASITPKSVSNRILVTIAGLFGCLGGPTLIGLYRDSSYCNMFQKHQADYNWEYSSHQFGFDYEDTPNTTNLITYHIAFATNGSLAYFNRNAGAFGIGWSTITLTEIAQ